MNVLKYHSILVLPSEKQLTGEWGHAWFGYSFCVALTLQHTFSDTKELHVYMPGREKEVYAKVKHME